MLPSNPPHFIYTHFFTASHIILLKNDMVILPGLYANTATAQTEEIVLQCSFEQLNEILHCEGYHADEVIEQLAEAITGNAILPFTMDVTDTGGLQCDCLLYCMQLIQVEEEESDEEDVMPKYFLRAFIKKNETINYDALRLPANKQKQLSCYLLLLAIQYDFYLYFKEEQVPYKTALQYASLIDPLIFLLAKTQHELQREGVRG